MAFEPSMPEGQDEGIAVDRLACRSTRESSVVSMMLVAMHIRRSQAWEIMPPWQKNKKMFTPRS